MMKISIAVLLMTTAAMAEELKIKRAPTMIRPVYTWSEPPVLPPSFETPSWVPNEETKKRALRRAYELNGNSMVGGMIDLSDDPVVTGRTVITPETKFNVLDATSAEKSKGK